MLSQLLPCCSPWFSMTFTHFGNCEGLHAPFRNFDLDFDSSYASNFGTVDADEDHGDGGEDDNNTDDDQNGNGDGDDDDYSQDKSAMITVMTLVGKLSWQPLLEKHSSQVLSGRTKRVYSGPSKEMP